MKSISVPALAAVCILSSACVRRTVTDGPVFTNPNSKHQYAGDDGLIEDKIVWIWQSEFWKSTP